MTTASPEEQARLLAIAELDTQLRQVAHQRRSLPEHDELTALAAETAAVQSQQGEVSIRVSDLERALRKAEADVEQVRTRAARDTERLTSGGLAARDLQGLERELVSLGRRQSELEDVELEVMEQLEAAQTEAATLATRAEDIRGRTDDATGRRDQALADLDARRAELTAQRDTGAAGVLPALLALYDRVADRSGGVAAARVEGSRCGGCRAGFSNADLAAIRQAAPDAVVQCEECSAILVRDQT